MVEGELLQLAALVVVAAVAHFVATRLHGPPEGLFILAGALARPVLRVDVELLVAVLFLSVAFVLFGAGVNLNVGRFTRMTLLPLLAFGLGGALAGGGLGAAVAWLAGWSLTDVGFAAVAVGFSSTILALRTLALRGEMADAHGRLLVGALLVQDVIALLLLAATPGVGPQQAGEFGPSIRLAATVALAVAAVVVGRALTGERAWRWMPDAESRALGGVGLLFAFMLVATRLGVPSATGAFLAGIAAAAFPANVRFRPVVRASREFFSPLFFVGLGAFVPFPAAEDAPLVMAFLAVILVAKPMLLALIARVAGYPPRASADAGVLAAPASEFALIILLSALLAGVLAPREGGILLTAVAGSMLVGSLAPRGIARAVAAVMPRGGPPPAVPSEGHVVVLGVGETGRAFVAAARHVGLDVAVLDVDPTALAAVPADVPRAQGEAADVDALRAVRAHRAAAVVSLVRDDDAAARAMLRLARERVHPLLVARVHDDDVAARLTAVGVRVIRPHEAAATALLAAVERLRSGG